jgi:hypothetical protein
MMTNLKPSLMSFSLSRLAYCLGALILGLGILPTQANAQSLGLAPAELQYKFKPGQPFQFDLSVSNDGDSPVVMQVNLTDLWYNDKNEKTFGPPGSSPRSAANWMEFVPRRFIAPAHGVGKVRVVVTPPLQVSGGYYAVVFVTSKPELVQAATAEKKAVYANIRLGSLILLAAENTEDSRIDVSDVQFTAPSTSRALKADFLVWNQGNTHVFPNARIAIVNSAHRLIAVTEGEDKRYLPQQRDRLSVSWGGTLSPGNYTAILSVTYGQGKIYTREFPFTVPNPEMTAERQ